MERDLPLKFTVFTPTYNRATLLHRVYTSLENQSFKNFEWLIIDDGSVDNTEEVVQEFVKKASFPIIYIKKENEGKVAAINDALNVAHGELFLVFDSDDWCSKDALSVFDKTWTDIPNDIKESYAAISCLKVFKDGKVVGEDYSRLKKYGLSYIDRFNNKVLGDKWECILTSVHRRNKYDLVKNEKYQAPEYAWLKLAKKYNTVYISDKLSIIEYQADGISCNNIVHRVGSSKSTILFYELAAEVSISLLTKSRSLTNLARFYLHDNNWIKAIGKSKFLFIPAAFMYVFDLWNMRKHFNK